LLFIFALCPVAKTSVEAPPIVEVAGVIVTVPTPRFLTSTNHPSGKHGTPEHVPVPARAIDTATDDAFEKVKSFPASDVVIGYVVPVWALTICAVARTGV
jgi:hypothetical protein